MSEPQVQGQQQSDAGWVPWGGSPTPIARIGDLDMDTTYEVRVRKTFHSLPPSDWSDAVRMTTDPA